MMRDENSNKRFYLYNETDISFKELHDKNPYVYSVRNFVKPIEIYFEFKKPGDYVCIKPSTHWTLSSPTIAVSCFSRSIGHLNLICPSETFFKSIKDARDKKGNYQYITGKHPYVKALLQFVRKDKYKITVLQQWSLEQRDDFANEIKELEQYVF